MKTVRAEGVRTDDIVHGRRLKPRSEACQARCPTQGTRTHIK